MCHQLCTSLFTSLGLKFSMTDITYSYKLASAILNREINLEKQLLSYSGNTWLKEKKFTLVNSDLRKIQEHQSKYLCLLKQHSCLLLTSSMLTMYVNS